MARLQFSVVRIQNTPGESEVLAVRVEIPVNEPRYHASSLSGAFPGSPLPCTCHVQHSSNSIYIAPIHKYNWSILLDNLQQTENNRATASKFEDEALNL